MPIPSNVNLLSKIQYRFPDWPLEIRYHNLEQRDKKSLQLTYYTKCQGHSHNRGKACRSFKILANLFLSSKYFKNLGLINSEPNSAYMLWLFVSRSWYFLYSGNKNTSWGINVGFNDCLDFIIGFFTILSHGLRCNFTSHLLI